MNSHTHTPHLTTVLGATGKTGSRVLRRLNEAGVPTRATSRRSDPPLDWEDRSTWPGALRGAEAAYVAYSPDLAVPGGVEAVSELAELAGEGGLQRLVLLSGRGEEDALAAERAVRARFDATTVVRCAWFDQNFSEGYLLEPVLSGEIALPAGAVREPFVDCEDIAAVATAALIDDRHAGETYELTGPRLLSFAEAVAEIARATGRRLDYVEIGIDDYVRGAADAGVPDDVIGLLRMLFSELLDGRNESVADGVERALGRPPRNFADYAREAAAAGAWTSSIGAVR